MGKLMRLPFASQKINLSVFQPSQCGHRDRSKTGKHRDPTSNRNLYESDVQLKVVESLGKLNNILNAFFTIILIV